MKEVLEYHNNNIEASSILETLELEEGQYFLVSSHREENIDTDENFLKLAETLNAISRVYEMPIIVSTHPRTRKRLDGMKFDFLENIRFLKPLGFLDYIKLQTKSKAVLSDSGTITEESSILNFPALNIRETQERHEGMEEGAVMLVGQDSERILQGLKILESQTSGQERNLAIVSDYNVNNVSEKVLRIIISYTDYINRVVWRK
jgi:UDP-N-acetylglucosamine 2-epimerase (non-hydrolysing)